MDEYIKKLTNAGFAVVFEPSPSTPARPMRLTVTPYKDLAYTSHGGIISINCVDEEDDMQEAIRNLIEQWNIFDATAQP